MLYIFGLFLCIGCSQIFAQPQSFWNTYELADLKNNMRNTHAGIKEQYYATKLLSRVNAADGICSSPINFNQSYQDLDSFFYYVLLNRHCNQIPKVHASSEMLDNALKSENIKDLIQALIVSSQTTQISTEDKVATMQKLLDGLEKLQPYDAHFLEVIHRSLDICEYFHQDSDFSSLVSAIHQKSVQLVPSADKSQFSVATVIGRIKWCTDKPLKLSGATIARIIDQLLPLKHDENPETKLHLFDSISAIHALKNSPIFLSLSNRRSSAPVYEINLHDLFGTKVESAKVEVTLKESKNGEVMMENLTLQRNVIDAAELSLSPNSYVAEFTVTVGDKRVNIINNKISFIVPIGDLAVKNVKFLISDSKSLSNARSLTEENSISEKSASALNLDFLHLEYTVSSDVKPSLSSVIVSNGEGISVMYTISTAHCEEGGSCKQRLSINLAEDVEKFRYSTGHYQISVFIGDSLLQVPIIWQVGTVFLKFPSRPDPKLALYARSLLHSSDVTLHALPEIEHVMRPPAKRAGDGAAAVFTFFVVVAMLIVLFYWLRTVIIDTGKISFISLALILSWLSLLTLYTGYWFSVDGFSFYATIKYLCVLAPLTFVLGRNSIRR